MFPQIADRRHSLKCLFVVSFVGELVFFALVDFPFLLIVFTKIVLMLDHFGVDYAGFEDFAFESFLFLFLFFMILVKLHDASFFFDLLEVEIPNLANFVFDFVVDFFVGEVVFGKPFLIFHGHYGKLEVNLIIKNKIFKVPLKLLL